jgi:hypothetical protein
VLVGDGHGAVPGEGRDAGDQLEQQAPGRVQVGAGVDVVSACLLGRQVGGGADDRRRLRGPRGVGGCPRDAEVHDLHLAGRGEHDVRRLDVAVHDPGGVGHLERRADVGGQLERPLGEQPALVVDDVAQRATGDELHDDVRDAVRVLAGVVDRHDARRVQRGRGLRLPPEPGLEGRVPCEVRPEHLDGHVAAEPDVDALADVGHAAGPDALAER